MERDMPGLVQPEAQAGFPEEVAPSERRRKDMQGGVGQGSNGSENFPGEDGGPWWAGPDSAQLEGGSEGL